MTGHGAAVSARAAEGGVWLVRIAGEFDDGHTVEMADALQRGLHAAGRLTVVDASDVAFADSSVLDTLLRARAEYAAAGRQLVIAGPSLAVRRLLDVTGTASAFVVADSLQAAMTY
ncbi:STAS domain-containing protein [Streptomyces sp. IBSBF 2435]|uniref:STAS domain-containing protein n=1 Tax=Streptomyces sp. IBSBF 2435 TaxID=2903531 RepID=UPI002FDC6820